MRMLVKIETAGAKPLRHGSAFWWETILGTTREKPTFTYAEIDGASDPYNEKSLGIFLRKLEKAGFIERVKPGGARVFRVVKRQSQCPVVTAEGQDCGNAVRLQNMWNVMRRRRTGFTVDDLAVDASTDSAVIARNTAKQYCLLLVRAGVLAVQKPGKRGEGRNIYVLKGSAASGPKAPRRMAAKLVFDPNRNIVLGDVIAEEERS
jgi:hypothetical protein